MSDDGDIRDVRILSRREVLDLVLKDRPGLRLTVCAAEILAVVMFADQAGCPVDEAIRDLLDHHCTDSDGEIKELLFCAISAVATQHMDLVRRVYGHMKEANERAAREEAVMQWPVSGSHGVFDVVPPWEEPPRSPVDEEEPVP